MSYSADLIEVSKNKDNEYLITMELEYPRMIHSEFMTHRVFSRNASSSRAIPVEKLIQEVQYNTAFPVYWGENIRGMQAKVEIKNLIDGLDPVRAWKKDAIAACQSAKKWADAGYHKQIVNRKIENYGHIRVIVTSTEWENFFALRCHEAAQPEIRKLAEMMEERYLEAISEDFDAKVLLDPLTDWHLPYITPQELEEHDLNILIKCSVARCARVSYLTHDKKKPNLQDDLRLYQMLADQKHMSPFEHQATCIPDNLTSNTFGKFSKEAYRTYGVTSVDIDQNLWSGNLKKFAQYRQIFAFNYEKKEQLQKEVDKVFNIEAI